jgi:hypothetical protein
MATRIVDRDVFFAANGIRRVKQFVIQIHEKSMMPTTILMT